MKQELDNFFKDKEINSLEDMNRAMKEFMIKSMRDVINNEITPQHAKAHEFMDQWKKNHDLKYVHKALELYPDCFLAKVCLIANQDIFDYIVHLEEMLSVEEKRLNNTGFMKKYRKGLVFTLDGEDYLKGMNELIQTYMKIGGFFKASKLAEKILLLDNTDVLGVRFVLAGLYALLEEESKLIKLYHSRKEEYIPYYLSFMCLYYKRGDFKKAKEYLELIEKKNPYFVSYVEKNLEQKTPENVKLGEESEVIMILDEMHYLIDFIPYIKDFIIKRGNV